MSIALERRRYMGVSESVVTYNLSPVGVLPLAYTAFSSNLSGTGVMTAHGTQYTIIFQVPTGIPLTDLEIMVYYNGNIISFENYAAAVGASPAAMRIATYDAYPSVGSACKERYWFTEGDTYDFTPNYEYLAVSLFNGNNWQYFSATCTLSNGGGV